MNCRKGLQGGILAAQAGQCLSTVCKFARSPIYSIVRIIHIMLNRLSLVETAHRAKVLPRSLNLGLRIAMRIGERPLLKKIGQNPRHAEKAICRALRARLAIFYVPLRRLRHTLSVLRYTFELDSEPLPT